MAPTKREYREVERISAAGLVVAKVIARVLGPIFRLRPFRSFIGKTDSARYGLIGSYHEHGRYQEAANLAIELLKKNRNAQEGIYFAGGREYWWLYMTSAAQSLDRCDNPEQREQVIEMARHGVEPFVGYDVAKSFLTFAGWKYRDGDVETAIEFAEFAARADDSWGEPDFMLGWYRLITGGDAFPHFSDAVRKDPEFFFRIANDDTCKQHPWIIRQLKFAARNELVTSIGPAPDE